ncbi:hypothetical protein BsWGS_08116 [Bradybaena similaris]
MRCVRTCSLRERFQRLPCYVEDCDLGFLQGTFLWTLLTEIDGEDNPLYFTKVPSELSDVQKRVKEFWEGPAPADINH